MSSEEKWLTIVKKQLIQQGKNPDDFEFFVNQSEGKVEARRKVNVSKKKVRHITKPSSKVTKATEDPRIVERKKSKTKADTLSVSKLEHRKGEEQKTKKKKKGSRKRDKLYYRVAKDVERTSRQYAIIETPSGRRNKNHGYYHSKKDKPPVTTFNMTSIKKLVVDSMKNEEKDGPIPASSAIKDDHPISEKKGERRRRRRRRRRR